MIKVEFINVGSNNKNWTATLASLTHSALYAQVKGQSAVMSRGVEFEYDSATNSGEIVVGGMRTVGHFRVVSP